MARRPTLRQTQVVASSGAAGRKATYSQLRKTGYSARAARNITNYSAKGNTKLARGGSLSARSAQRIVRTGSSGG